MIISGKQVQEMLRLYADQNQKAKQAVRPQQSAAKRDEVVLSPKAQEFAQLLQQAKAAPDVREDKVAELKAKLDSGNYSVDAKDIADKMIGRVLADRLR